LIDLLLGRHPEDLRTLELKYRQQIQVSERSLAVDVANLTNDPELRAALNICSEMRRPDPLLPVDTMLVHKHIEEIIGLVESTFPSENTYLKLFNILLRSSDPHITQITVSYQMRTQMQLDEAIRRNMQFNKMGKKILVHAVRTAKDITYRDAMLLRDVLGAKSMIGRRNNEKLAIRVVRMHWYRQHWKQIRAAYTGVTGKTLGEQVRSTSGLLGELLRAMCGEYM
jgi:annexin A7/11